MKKVQLVINGTKREFVVGPGQVLLQLLREDLDLTGQTVLRPERPVRGLYGHRRWKGDTVLSHQGSGPGRRRCHHC